MDFQKHVLVIFLCLIACEGKSYSNHPLFMGIPTDLRELDFYRNLTEVYDIVYWRPPGALYGAVQFSISPEQLETLHRDTKVNNITFNVVMMDIQRAFDMQTVKPYLQNRLDTFDWTGFYNIDAIYNWLKDLQTSNPNILELEKIGVSTEKRFIYAVKIKYPGIETRPRVIIEGGIHGREWISPAFVTYLINELVNAHRSNNTNLKKIALAYEWLIVPVLNPDGYEYTHTTDRLWSKNRHFNHGVDLNRNFGIAFGTVGVDTNIFSDTYGGQAVFSEPETRAMAHFVEKNKDNLKYYLAFHSFGQHFIIPYSFTIVHLENYDEVKTKAVKAMTELSKIYGTEYTVGTALETLGYLMSGTSTCWAKKVFEVPYVGSIRLRDGGLFGFALPPEQILPTCLETMEALYSFLDPDIFKTAELRARPAERPATLNRIRSQGRVTFPELVLIFMCFFLAL